MVLLGASRSMALQGAKMRVPLIKFRYGRQQANQASAESPVKQAGQTSSVKATKVTFTETELPARFNRQLISEEEIEYINRGGPA